MPILKKLKSSFSSRQRFLKIKPNFLRKLVEITVKYALHLEGHKCHCKALEHFVLDKAATNTSDALRGLPLSHLFECHSGMTYAAESNGAFSYFHQLSRVKIHFCLKQKLLKTTQYKALVSYMISSSVKTVPLKFYSKYIL